LVYKQDNVPEFPEPPVWLYVMELANEILKNEHPSAFEDKNQI
jgi:hypothetical protein